MAESDNILTKLEDLMLYLIPETRRGPSDAYDNATGSHVVRLAFVLARCS